MTTRSLRLLDRRALLLAAPSWIATSSAAVARTPPFEAYKSATCGCCGAWVEHLRGAGFDGRVIDLADVEPIKDRLGVPADLRSCHTATIGGFVVEGHVPVREILRLLRERPQASGLSVPDMPIGSPGMEMGDRREPYDVILFSASRRSVYARY